MFESSIKEFHELLVHKSSNFYIVCHTCYSKYYFKRITVNNNLTVYSWEGNFCDSMFYRHKDFGQRLTNNVVLLRVSQKAVRHHNS